MDIRFVTHSGSTYVLTEDLFGLVLLQTDPWGDHGQLVVSVDSFEPLSIGARGEFWGCDALGRPHYHVSTSPVRQIMVCASRASRRLETVS